jgi:hypothetical protein
MWNFSTLAFRREMTYLHTGTDRKQPMSKVVTANNLQTGAVVFLSASGTWVSAVDQAADYADDAAAEDGLVIARRDARQAIIVDPFIAETNGTVDGKAKMTLRDSIRAYGPTIHFLPGAPTTA